ncbi:MAG: phenylacetate--CoA ligase [archaeon]
MVMYWDPSVERTPRNELRSLQERSLRALLSYVYAHSDFHRKRFKEAAIDPRNINSLEDLRKLPFMVKRDFRDTYPTGMFCVPKNQIVRYHASSGTTGKPTLVGYTRNDITEWSTSLARGLTSLGIGRGDVMQNAYGYGLFTGGLGFHYAGEMVGAVVLPTGAGTTERQIELMQDLDTTAIACTPSYFLYLCETARALGVNLRETKLKAGLFGAEPWSEDMRKRIEDNGIKAYDVYGTSELSGPLFTECTSQKGMHVWADQFLVEVVDPKTGENVSDGERGELVFTTLKKEALPLIRYRTGDLTTLDSEVCDCGRTHPRIMKMLGRVDDMLVIRGINVFPSQVESALMRIPELGDNYELIVDRVHELDTLTVRVEARKEIFADRASALPALESRVSHVLRNILSIDVKVEIVEPQKIARSIGKAKRVIDKRKI